MYYVRAGATEPQNWVLHLEGGRGCGTYEGCEARWCDRGIYSREKMSSREGHATLLGHGIFDPDPARNAFAGWTHVFLYYCTSDYWLGQRSSVSLVSPDDPLVSYELDFRGHDVLGAILEELLERPGKLAELGMPVLASADRVLVTGSSAGGLGLMQQLDRVATMISSRGDAEVRGVVDSWFPPGAELFGGGSYSGDFARAMEAPLFLVHSLAMDGMYGAEGEASCSAAHPSAPWRCLDAAHVLLNHTATPFFVFMDQDDRVVCPRPCADAVRDQLQDLERLTSDGPWRDEPPEALEAAGWFSPRCGSHQAIATKADGGARFLVDEVPLAGPGGASWYRYHDVLQAWMDGVGTTQVVRADEGLADCP
jgi:hypothetical protein